MATQEITKIGKRGTVVIPAAFRRRFALNEGDTVIIEACENGVSVRPAVALTIEAYTPERIAEFLLNNSMDVDDYGSAVAEVRKMGLDPSTIDHEKPPGA